MKKTSFYVPISCLFFLLFFPNASYSQSAKDAYKALKKVQARVQVGVSYKDYSSVIGEAKAEVDSYLESKKSKENPQATNHIKKAMEYYILAGEIWNIKFGFGRAEDIIFTDSDKGNLIRRLYPKSKVFTDPRLSPHYYIPYILSDIWNDASEELKRASSFLKD